MEEREYVEIDFKCEVQINDEGQILGACALDNYRGAENAIFSSDPNAYVCRSGQNGFCVKHFIGNVPKRNMEVHPGSHCNYSIDGLIDVSKSETK